VAVSYWMRGNPGQDQQILMNNEAYTAGENATSGPPWRRVVWLKIEAFATEDEDVYRCIAANSHGRAEGFIRLHGRGSDTRVNFFRKQTITIKNLYVYFQRLTSPKNI